MRHSTDTAWTPVALSGALYPEEVRPAFTTTLSIALWRDAHGIAHATHTQCPHRGMNLAYGFVRDQHLACAYHGWQYDAAGQCVYIPAHPDLPPARSICASIYACVETGGVIFVHADSETKTAPEEPAHPQFGIRTVTIDARPGVVWNMLDADETDFWISLRTPENIVCTVQALPESRTAVHVLMRGEHATTESRLAVARWACSLRDRCERLSKGHG